MQNDYKYHQGLASLGGFFGNQARNYLRQATRAKVRNIKIKEKYVN